MLWAANKDLIHELDRRYVDQLLALNN
jgi:hypothetical protein